MITRALKIFKVLILRAMPGLLNLGTLMILGGWLAVGAYGWFSTVIATSGFIARLVFGPIINGIISQYATMEVEGQERPYSATLIWVVIAIAIILMMVGGITSYMLPGSGIFVVVVISFGLFLTAQEIFRVRLRIWTYGGIAVLQALIYMGYVFVMVEKTPTALTALTGFAISYGIAALVAIMFLKVPHPKYVDIRLLRKTFRIGATYTGSSMVEQGIFLGMRYLLLIFGSPHHLGVFSFSIDIAQRLIGFLINAVGFIIIPEAFKNATQTGLSAFRKQLNTGAAVALVLSCVAFVFVMALAQTGFVKAFNGPLFDPVIMAFIVVAIMINRIKKLTIDPVAMHIHYTSAILFGYMFGAPVAVAGGALSLYVNLQYGVEVSYILAYSVSAGVAAALIHKRIKSFAKEDMPHD